jgi:imidazolonepropionase-like amidohydrolase
LAKLLDVAGRGAEAIRLARRAGVKVGFGTDLLGPLHRLQLHEFRLRGEIEDPLEVLRSATSVNAELLNRTGELGVVRTGAAADLVAVDGDPLRDLSCLYQDGPSLVVKAGRMAYSRL